MRKHLEQRLITSTLQGLMQHDQVIDPPIESENTLRTAFLPLPSHVFRPHLPRRGNPPPCRGISTMISPASLPRLSGSGAGSHFPRISTRDIVSFFLFTLLYSSTAGAGLYTECFALLSLLSLRIITWFWKHIQKCFRAQIDHHEGPQHEHESIL